MSFFYGRAMVRSIIAVILVGAWIIWYDGPSWAWILLAFYILFTFGLATFMETRVQKKLQARAEEPESDE